MAFRPYQSIEQFRSVIRQVVNKARYDGVDAAGEPIYNHTKPIPTLKYKGTVKLHGTNACVHRTPQGEYLFQSRNNTINVENDNAGFVNAMITKPLDELFFMFDEDADVYIYGEWCGENIQKGVAITGLPKMFVIFEVVIDGFKVKDIRDIHMHQHNIYNVDDFTTYYMDIDFNAPELSQNKLIALTEEVEAECPVGRYFNVNGVGEGIVWKLHKDCDNFRVGDGSLTFKVKGEKHSASKVKTLAAVDIEKVNSLAEFVDTVVTPSRLQQGIDYLKEMKLEVSMKSTGEFVRWVYNDIIKEESDVIVASGLVVKEVGAAVSKPTRDWYFKHLEA